MSTETAETLDHLWQRFADYGSGWELSMERDWHQGGQPVYHLRLFGRAYPPGYELVGLDLAALLRQAISEAMVDSDDAQPAQ